MAEHWPIDVDSLKKGDLIAPEVIEKWGGISRHAEGYGFKVLAFKDWLERALRDRGRPICLKGEQYGLRALDDPDASRYRSQRQKRALRAVAIQHRGLAEVDVRRLSPEERQVHDRRTVVSGLFVSAIAGARKEIHQLPHRRQTPGLPSADGNGRNNK